jgi:hypothetical protein
MFCNVSSCNSESITFAEPEGKCTIMCNVTMEKCIREEESIVINL